MARLIYSAITSLDGYVADRDGNFDWATPDEEVHRFVNDLERPIGTYLYGRRLYEVMKYWQTADRDLSVGGPGLAAAALEAGLVEELRLIAVPVVVGGGTAWLPDDVRID